MTLPLKRYVFLQFTVVILGILWIGVLFAKQGASAVILPCGLLWLTLYALGLLSEGRAYALRFETLRLLVIVPLCIGAMSAKDLIGLANPVLLGLSAGYILASLVGLRIVATKGESIALESQQ